MPRPVPKDFVRPARVTREPREASSKAPLKSLLKELPASYVEDIRNNEGLRACCRDIDNLTCQTFITDENATSADFLVIECTVCGAKHRRAAHGSGGVST